MATVYGSTIVEADSEKVSALVRNFNALPEWFPFIISSELRAGDAPDRIVQKEPCSTGRGGGACGNGFWN